MVAIWSCKKPGVIAAAGLQIADLARFLDANRFPAGIKCEAGFRLETL
jgi:hypothetical protein